MKHTTWSSRLVASADGTGVVAHPGSVAVRLLADRSGLANEVVGNLDIQRATATRDFTTPAQRSSHKVESGK